MTPYSMAFNLLAASHQEVLAFVVPLNVHQQSPARAKLGWVVGPWKSVAGTMGQQLFGHD